ncbi:hypothetical protein BDB01DRAFT_847067 [Pilobolus umbonatus]|nr:hypothetical protein BDB01DRAFT_847067 [Pilobolus umbonatus]
MAVITNFDDIRTSELNILQRQFVASPFYQNNNNSKPTKLAIFDFDSTLFFSPLLSPTLWSQSFINSITSQGVYGPGWWRDIHSLELGPLEELKKTAWEGYWNEEVVELARKAIKDKDTMAVLLTGRRYHPFHRIIPHMLSSKHLEFDLLGLRPDPELASDNLMDDIHLASKKSVFQSTMHFKTCFILNILHEVPSIKHVTMWDDRFYHVRSFQSYLDTLYDKSIIDSGNVIYVHGIRPAYNPEWEKKVISKILRAHNNTGTNEKEITLVPHTTTVALSPESTQKLRDMFQSEFDNQMKKNKSTLKWKHYGGERPEFFGDHIYIDHKHQKRKSAPVYKVGKTVSVTLEKVSSSPDLPCLLLQVKIDHEYERYILPLWYKPTEFNEIMGQRNIPWRTLPQEQRLVLTGKVHNLHRLGVVQIIGHKRSYSDVDSDETTTYSAVPRKRQH